MTDYSYMQITSTKIYLTLPGKLWNQEAKKQVKYITYEAALS